MGPQALGQLAKSPGKMGRDAWRSKISADSGKELHDAIEDGCEDGDALVGTGEDDDEEEWEECEDDWDELEKLERAIDGRDDGDEEEGTPASSKKQQKSEHDDVVVICDSDEEQAAAGNEWEEVSVGTKTGGSLPADAQVRKATKQDRLRALHLHHAHLLCLLARGSFLSKQCHGLRLQRRMDRIKLAGKLALPSPHCMRVHHIRAVLDWLHGNFEVTEEDKSKPEKLTDVSLAKALDAGKGSHLAKCLVLVAFLRRLGLQTRLVCTLQPCTYKLKGVIQLSGGGIRFQRVLPKAASRKTSSAVAAGSALKRKKLAGKGGTEDASEEMSGAVETGGGKGRKKAKAGDSDTNAAKKDANGKIQASHLKPF